MKQCYECGAMPRLLYKGRCPDCLPAQDVRSLEAIVARMGWPPIEKWPGSPVEVVIDKDREEEPKDE